MKIAVISDTHGHVDPTLSSYLKDCDQVWHAGDIGSMETFNFFNSQYEFKAIYGNVDSKEIRMVAPEYLCFQLENMNVMMIHIAGRPPKYNKRVMDLLKENGVPDILVCGHSHILRVERDPLQKRTLCINPGAVGNHGFHKIKTLIKFELHEGHICDMKAIELGSRAKSK